MGPVAIWNQVSLEDRIHRKLITKLKDLKSLCSWWHGRSPYQPWMHILRPILCKKWISILFMLLLLLFSATSGQLQLLTDIFQIQHPFWEIRWLGHFQILMPGNYYLDSAQKYWDYFSAGSHFPGGSQRQFYTSDMTWRNFRSLLRRESSCCCCWYCHSLVKTERLEWWPFKKNKCY